MKKSLLRMFLIAQFMLMELFITGVFANPASPPGPGSNPIEAGGSPIGRSIDDGIGILIALGIAYGCYKIYEIWKKKKIRLKEEEHV
jgi:hypothetical protein